jgi:hypothetical protein|tara:strand:- start:34 stop:1221 length:1188 start_codon:yes stop_codon:yes gene_type:complete
MLITYNDESIYVIILLFIIIIIIFYYYKRELVVKPLYSDDSGFYVTFQYELEEDDKLDDDMGKLFGKHSRSTLLDTGSMWIDIGSVMDEHDKKIFKKRLDDIGKVGASNLLVTNLDYGGDVIEGNDGDNKDCKSKIDTPGVVETYFLQGLVHISPNLKIKNLIGFSTIDNSCNHPQWYNDIQEGSSTIFGLDNKLKLPLTNYKDYDKNKYKNWDFDSLNSIKNMIGQLPQGRKTIEMDLNSLEFKIGSRLYPFFNFSIFSSKGVGDNSMFYFVMSDETQDYNVLFDTGTAVSWIENPKLAHKKDSIKRLYAKSNKTNITTGYLDFNIILSAGDKSLDAKKIDGDVNKKKEYYNNINTKHDYNYESINGIDLIFGRSDMLNHRIHIDYDLNLLTFI